MIEIPFIYKMTVSTEKGDEVDRTYREVMPFVPEELSSDDCPVVLRSHGFLPLYIGDGEIPPPVEFRLHHGEIYEPLRHAPWNGGQCRIQGVSQDWNEDRLASHMITIMRPENHCLNVEDVKLKGPPRADRVIDARGRDQVIKTMETFSRDFIFIDRMMYRRTPEPVLLASMHGVSLCRSIMSISDEERHHAYRLDDLPAAIRRAELLHETSRGSHSPLRMPEYELLDTGWLEYTIEQSTSLQAIRKFNRHVEDMLPRLPIPVMRAFCGLRDSLRPLQYDPNFVVDINVVLAKVEDLADEIKQTNVDICTTVILDVVDRARAAMTIDMDALQGFHL